MLVACGRVASKPPPAVDTRKGLPTLPIEAKIVLRAAEASDAAAATLADSSGQHASVPPPPLAAVTPGTLNTSSREITLPRNRTSRPLLAFVSSGPWLAVAGVVVAYLGWIRPASLVLLLAERCASSTSKTALTMPSSA